MFAWGESARARCNLSECLLGDKWVDVGLNMFFRRGELKEVLRHYESESGRPAVELGWGPPTRYMGTLESMKSGFVALFDLAEHLVDVGHGKGMFGRKPHGF